MKSLALLLILAGGLIVTNSCEIYTPPPCPVPEPCPAPEPCPESECPFVICDEQAEEVEAVEVQEDGDFFERINEVLNKRYLYHSYCSDRPDAFSGICSNKRPKFQGVLEK